MARDDLHGLIDRLPVAVFRTTPDGRILMVNRAFANLFGYDPKEDMYRISARDLYVDPEDRPALIQAVSRRSTTPVVVEMKRADGSQFSAQVSGTLYTADDGTVCIEGAFVRVRDEGAGLPEQQWEVIFDRYYRAHQPEGLQASVGLGLSLSRDLARSMGGDLTYRTEDGMSLFELTLRRANQGD